MDGGSGSGGPESDACRRKASCRSRRTHFSCGRRSPDERVEITCSNLRQQELIAVCFCRRRKRPLQPRGARPRPRRSPAANLSSIAQQRRLIPSWIAPTLCVPPLPPSCHCPPMFIVALPVCAPVSEGCCALQPCECVRRFGFAYAAGKRPPVLKSEGGLRCRRSTSRSASRWMARLATWGRTSR